MTDTATPSPTSDADVRPPRPLAAWIVALLGVLAGVALAVLAYELFLQPPQPNAVDIGFAQDMSVHHAQAVDMVELVRAGGDDIDVRRLAIDMELNQQAQLGQMQGWLALWDEPNTNPGQVMAWMGMGVPADGRMPGLATAEELNALNAAEGVAADRLFLELMIEHHAGGIHMAEAAAADASMAPVRTLADQMARAQTSEIRTLEELLEGLGG